MRWLLTLLTLLMVGLLGAGGPAVGATTATPWPVTPPEVLDPFDPPPKRWLAGHRGVDLAATLDQEVRSPIAGRISFSGVVVDRPLVVITTGDRQVSLEPVQTELSVGSLVQKGAVIGTLAPGNGHCGSRTCLHWGLRVAGAYRDPLLLVRSMQPVLIPTPD